MRNPKLVELSIVSIGAYEHAKFKPVGFAAALNQNQQGFIAKALAAKKHSACEKCAGNLTLSCLSCSKEHPLAGTNQTGEKKMSASDKPLDAEAVKAIIDQHGKNLEEACKASIAEAVTKATEAAKEAAKLVNSRVSSKT